MFVRETSNLTGRQTPHKCEVLDNTGDQWLVEFEWRGQPRREWMTPSPTDTGVSRLSCIWYDLELVK